MTPTAALSVWNRFSTLSAHLIDGGELWAAKGKAGVLADVTVTVDLRDEKASHWPFGSPDRRSRFEPQRVAIEDANGIYGDVVTDEMTTASGKVAQLTFGGGQDRPQSA